MTGSGQSRRDAAGSFSGELANSLERESEGKPGRQDNPMTLADQRIGGCKVHVGSQDQENLVRKRYLSPWASQDGAGINFEPILVHQINGQVFKKSTGNQSHMQVWF